MNQEQQAEWLTCAEDPLYFIDTYCQIYDATEKVWIPFKLWRKQIEALDLIFHEQLAIILKARQLGLTWLVLGFSLWLMIFHPAATVLIFSRRDTEAMYLLSGERLGGMLLRLPGWMRPRIKAANQHELILVNGSVARAFPTSAGDSYTATLAIVDEADLVPDLNRLMRAVKPTIDGGGKMILLSRSNKSEPESEFKNIYRGAKKGESPWKYIFLPWWSRPGRTRAWYEAQKADILSRTKSLDDLHEQYPATDTEALAPRTLDKRIPPDWLEACYSEEPGLPESQLPKGMPAVSHLELQIYRLPEALRSYVLGADPAEGNPTSDDSALEVVDVMTGEEVASLAGKFEPSTLAMYADQLAELYNDAGIMVERNNHGHAVIQWLEEHSSREVLKGYDERPGWLSSQRGKALLYSGAAESFRDQEAILHNFDTFTQLQSVEGKTLLAPEGMRDDRADAYALALQGAKTAAASGGFAMSYVSGGRPNGS